MTFVRTLAWLAFAVVAGLASALGGYYWIEQPLWVGEYTGAKNAFGITADGSTLVSFLRTTGNDSGECGHRVIRHDARTGRVQGTWFIKIDPRQLETSAPRLLRGELGIADDDFGSERSKPNWDKEPGLITPVQAPPEYIVATRNSRLQSWQEAVNPWLAKIGLPLFRPKSEFSVVVLDARSGLKNGEMPQPGTHYVLGPRGDILAAYDPEGRIVVWDVRRTPVRWALALGLITAIGVLLLACWRNRPSRIPAAH